MSTIPTVRVSGPAEVLAAIETRLGFRPADSLAVASVRPSHTPDLSGLGILGLVARVDLAPLDGPDAASITRTLVRHLHDDGATFVLAAAYTPDRQAAHRAAVLLDEHLDVPMAMLQVTASTYQPLDAPDPARPLTDLDATVVAATRTAQGICLAATEDDLTALPTPDDATIDRARAAWARAASEDTTRLHAGLDCWLAACHQHEAPNAATLGAIGALLDVGAGRDAALVSLIPDTPADLPHQGLNPNPATIAGYTHALDCLISPEHALPPDADLIETATTVLATIAAVAEPGHRAPALTLCGWLAWWTGDGVRARRWIDKARDDIPDYRLAALLTIALDRGLPPGHILAARP